MESVISGVSCIICLEVFRDSPGYQPILLPQCGHSVCLSCLLQLQKVGGPHFSCPSCRAIHTGPAAEELPINYSLMGTAEMLMELHPNLQLENCVTHNDYLNTTNDVSFSVDIKDGDKESDKKETKDKVANTSSCLVEKQASDYPLQLPESMEKPMTKKSHKMNGKKFNKIKQNLITGSAFVADLLL